MKVSDLKTINGRFRDIRRRAGMTQKEFGDAIGMTRVSVNSIEIGRFRPTLDVIQSIHVRFGVSYEWLIDGKEDVSIKEGADLKRRLQEMEQLVEELRANNKMLRQFNDMLKKG